MLRPKRGSFHDRIYCDLIIGKKRFVRKRALYREVSDRYGIARVVVRYVYDKYVRVNLRDHQPSELF
jgi:hypothetical protein